MQSREKMEIAEKIQQYILTHYKDDNFSTEAVFTHFGYSPRHLNRLFKTFTGKTINEYLKCLQLTDSSYAIENGKSILNVAVQWGYQSGEGFTKTFKKQFGTTPSEYQKSQGMITRFIPYPVRHAYEHYYGEEKMEREVIVCTSYIVEKTRRKLILLRSVYANDYWSFCEERCCDWEGYLNSHLHKLDTAAILTLPKQLVKAGTSNIAAGIEVPIDCSTENLPMEYDVIELEPCKMLYFKSQPFTDSGDFGQYIDAVNQAYTTYDFEHADFAPAPHLAPSMNFGAETTTGAKIAHPVQTKTL